MAIIRHCDVWDCKNVATQLVAYDVTPEGEFAEYVYMWHCAEEGHWQEIDRNKPAGSVWAYSDDDTRLNGF
jgi:hypothetical protein